MSRRIAVVLLGWVVAFAGPAVRAEEAKQPPTAVEKEDPNHEELRKLRAAVEKAVNEKDLDALLKQVDPNVVVVWQNGEISRGHKGIRDYYDKYMGGPGAILDAYTVDIKPAELTILYGDHTGISYGTMNSHFKFKDGRTLDVNGPFSATLVKEDGRWQLASVHASVGLFDNPLVAMERNTLYWGCAIAAVVGLVVGLVIMAMFRRRKAA